MKDENLIFDVGMHKGEDTRYYLAKGSRVVAIDADPRMVEAAQATLGDAGGRLTIVHCAVGARAGDVEFYQSEKTVWSSIDPKIAGRDAKNATTIRIRTRTLPDLFAEYGVPYYCKIDVEGQDLACLQTLTGAENLPTFISCESECGGDKEPPSEAEALQTLEQLARLGYRRFKLVDQTSLAVLPPSGVVYAERPSLTARLRKRFGLGGYEHYSYQIMVDKNTSRLRERHAYQFPSGASGPFGENLDGEWLDLATARMTLVRHRRDYFRLMGAKSYGFWCDWHATR